MPNKLRKRLLVDPQLQGSLMMRAALHWFFCIATVAFVLLAWRIATGPEQPSFWAYLRVDSLLYDFGPALVASLVLLPVAVIDSVRVSNRFAGPVYRMRKLMADIRRGEHVEPLRFRDGDFWQDFATDFNDLVERIQGPAKTNGEESTGAWLAVHHDEEASV